jgi:hypothetical protein
LADVVFMMDATGSMEDAFFAACDKVLDIAHGLHKDNQNRDFKFGCVCYRDPVSDPDDEHQVHDLVTHHEIEDLQDWLETIEADGGGDGPEDYVGALETALNRMSWRPGSKRGLVWIADAPAHGRRFCGEENHESEGPKLEALIECIACERFNFYGLSLNNGADRTFFEMEKIYKAHGGP